MAASLATRTEFESRRRRVARMPGKTFFRYMAVDLLLPHEAPEPDAIVLPCSQGMNLDLWLAETPPDMWRHLAATGAPVIFDTSGEGTRYQRATFEALNGFLARTGLSVRQCLYITQHRLFETAYAADPPDTGERMRVMHYDYFIRHFFHFGTLRVERIFRQRLARFEARSSERPYRFICLNQMLRATKLLFLLQALDDGYLPQGLISIADFSQAGPCLAGLLKKGAFAWHAEGVAHRLPELEAFSGRFLGQDVRTDADGRHISVPFGNTEMPEHDQSWFSVITETEMTAAPIRITEKVFKPLLNFHPVLILGNPGSLEFIRDLGFETFSSIYDESYDLEPHPVRRFRLVYQQFEKQCRADEATLARQEHRIREQLVHNAQWGLTKLPAVLRQRDQAFLDQIFARP